MAPGTAMLRPDYGTRARGIGDPQAGAEVVRVLDTVEDEEQGIMEIRLQQAAQIHGLLLRARPATGDDALVAATAGELVERWTGGVLRLDAKARGCGQDRRQCRVGRARLHP
jgi:hypothetical protein